MKIDLHTHGKLAKKLTFSPEYTKILFQEAKEAGLDAICLTEHFNTLGFIEVYEYIKNHYERSGDCFLAEGIKVFPGMEIDIREGGHIVALGDYDAIINLNLELEPNKEKGKFISFEELLEKKQKYQLHLIAAHAFREGSNIPSLDLELLQRFDYIEINGKDYAVSGEKAVDEIKIFARKCGRFVVAGSDTHQSFQYGSIWNELGNDVETYDELFGELNSGNYKIHYSSDAVYRVKVAGILKKALKEIYALGGDYVSVMK